jgi:hypothetical protein
MCFSLTYISADGIVRSFAYIRGLKILLVLQTQNMTLAIATLLDEEFHPRV